VSIFCSQAAVHGAFASEVNFIVLLFYP